MFLYRKAVSPAKKMQKALVEYTKNKNTPLIVKEMYDIKTQNEFGYLSDIISDLALEVDLYTKENVKIAAERERTQKELYQAREESYPFCHSVHLRDQPKTPPCIWGRLFIIFHMSKRKEGGF